MAGVNTMVGQSEERGALSLVFCATVPELQGARPYQSLAGFVAVTAFAQCERIRAAPMLDRRVCKCTLRACGMCMVCVFHVLACVTKQSPNLSKA